MSKALSKREQDLARRARAQGKGGSESKGGPRILGAIAAVVAVGLIVWVALPGEPTETREANVAAFGLEDDPFLGDPEAPVVLVGYESPHCSSCKQFHSQFLPQLKADYFDTGRAVYYYVQGTIGDDFESSVAQECAYAEGGNDAFWRITDMFYARSYTYTTPDLESWLRQVADEQGLDEAALLSCFENQDTSKNVSEDWNVGDEFGARGTPTFWAFGPEGEAQKIRSYGQVGDTLEQLLAESGA